MIHGWPVYLGQYEIDWLWISLTWVFFQFETLNKKTGNTSAYTIFLPNNPKPFGSCGSEAVQIGPGLTMASIAP